MCVCVSSRLSCLAPLSGAQMPGGDRDITRSKTHETKHSVSSANTSASARACLLVAFVCTSPVTLLFSPPLVKDPLPATLNPAL